ncbi:dTDP-4-dehydrorhamnose reductase [Elysia marginata]|uniref:Methionine adenosyltransferase 2 subunit beta n=1 Tax=Elysia marginata TaxID=1093978 RepID=A0AAV4HH22_9GAST|nr:dTDP-4-dehydrorhamnose reductase [Elysia marginata]
MSRIWVSGEGGQLASEIKELSTSHSEAFFFTRSSVLDISNERDVTHFVDQQGIDTIINCAAYTQVDKAEEEIARARHTNAHAVELLANISKERDIKLIHFSTDYVFDGIQSHPYTENDQPNPQSVYGQTKLEGENAIRKVAPQRAAIIRTSWLYSSYGQNFIKTILKLAKERGHLQVVSDQLGAPTYAADLAECTLTLLPHIARGVEVFHYANSGSTSWYNYTQKAVKIARLNCQIEPILTKDYPTVAPRPAYSLLDTSKIRKRLGIAVPRWEESLLKCLNKIGLVA